MLSLPAIAIAIAMGHALLNPMPMAEQAIPLVTDYDTLLHHHLDREHVLIEEFAYPSWKSNVPKKERST